MPVGILSKKCPGHNCYVDKRSARTLVSLRFASFFEFFDYDLECFYPCVLLIDRL